MPYQQNLGVVTPADVKSRINVTWGDISSQALTRFQADEGLSPLYTVALLTRAVDSRSGPGTAYHELNYYGPGYELNIAGQYGNWFLTTNGDYIPVSAATDAVRDRREKAAIAAAEAKTRAAAAAAKAAADAKAASAATDKRIRAAIATATPTAIKEIIGQWDFPAAGISASVISDILTAVVNRIVTLASIALGGTVDR